MNSVEYCKYIHDIFGKITSRSMFGGHCLYKGGTIFAIIASDVLYLKVDETNQPDFEARGSEQFTYDAREKRRSLSYWQVPLEVMEQEELMKWVKKSYRAALRARGRKLDKVNKLLIWKKSA